MRIFITGGSGFVGGHVIEHLAADHELLALARSDASAAAVRAFGAKPVRASLGAIAPVFLAGVDVVIHCAAFVEEWGTRDDFWAVNVEGTRQLLDAARQAGVRRFIHIGTEAAVFDGHDLVDIDESHPYPARHRFLYSETKAAAESLVLAANRDDFLTISLRPRFVWGPRDKTVLPSIIAMVAKGGFAWIDGGRDLTSTTHVHNLAHAVGLALTAGIGGQAYFIVDEGTRTLREMLTGLAATRGVRLPDRKLPGFVARALANVCEALWRLVRAKKAPPLTRFAAYMMSATITLRGDKAKADLGYEPTVSVDDGLRMLSAAGASRQTGAELTEKGPNAARVHA